MNNAERYLKGNLVSLQKTQEPPKEKSGLRILVVDDDSLNQRLLAILLTRHNHIVSSAYSGSDVLDVITEKQFDLIFNAWYINSCGFEWAAHYLYHISVLKCYVHTCMSAINIFS